MLCSGPTSTGGVNVFVRLTCRRAAMTLIELLVVIAILAILAGLALPALNGAREMGRRCSCGNNMRQIALAAHSHEGSSGALPHGGWCGGNAPTPYPGRGKGIGNGNGNGSGNGKGKAPGGVTTAQTVGFQPASGRDQYAGWAYQILPHLDEELLHRRPPEVAIATPVEVYFCPSRSGPRVLPPQAAQVALYHDDPRQGMFAISQPIAHAGLDYASAYADPSLTDPGTPRYQDFFSPSPQPESSGAIIRLKITTNRYPPRPLVSLITRRDIKDGSTHTLLFAEKRMNSAALGQYQLDDDQGYTAGWDFDANRNASLPPERDYDAPLATLKNPLTYTDELRKLSQFGSAHRQSFNAAFADGSVRQISYSIEPLVFHRMGRRNDGRTLEE